MSLIGWIIVGVYVVGWLFTANRLFNTHKAPPRDWQDRSFRLHLAFSCGLLSLFWPLSIVYLIIRGKAVPEK